ncbi:riboflavin kinase [Kipferlia bialata]|uniref:riboflavin kinase n=1 Tax=Kipferlia bialata TaxID=797122 RepID=A0A9K3GF90_9EUKA|nr:riboflavin kinase [Kipferlia bialata]|eukprot:g1069.t1
MPTPPEHRFYQPVNRLCHGTVIKGYQKGRTIGFPTANVCQYPGTDTDGDTATPEGVYVGFATVRGILHEVKPAIISVGINPTFSDRGLTVEAHIMHDFQCHRTPAEIEAIKQRGETPLPEFYGHDIRVLLLGRIREMIKFKGLAELKANISTDYSYAESLFCTGWMRQRGDAVDAQGVMVQGWEGDMPWRKEEGEA